MDLGNQRETNVGPVCAEADASKPRRKFRPLQVYCLPEERARIGASAKAAGLSVSEYLRRIGMGYQVTGKVDFDAVLVLARINGDLGRLGGLLKMWLSDDARMVRFSDQHILALLAKIEIVSQAMLPVMEDILLKQRAGTDAGSSDVLAAKTEDVHQPARHRRGKHD